MPRYCYSLNGDSGISMRTVSDDYTPGSGEHVTSPEPASVLALDTLFPGSADALARREADAERLRLVADSYGGAEKRVSLYGYLGELNAYMIDGVATSEQIADRALLVDAAKWEQGMIDAVLLVTASSGAVWPAAPVGLAALAASS